ncbi:MAG: 23S rRNA (uracil(1939)-C(5))-methyltransferase RlmD [Chloroflexi bacterium]|nr:23S rRNA (uracil(1939)-C(5))-methyltransferase RlmD [Chloroflexota bacterium]
MNMILDLTNMAPTGEAIGRYEGMVVFVPFGLPDETVEVEVTHRRRNYAHARILRVLHPSPHRVAPPCPYFGACGGCEWQHIAYGTQLIFKTESVQGQLRRIGRLAEVIVLPCLPSPEMYGYRNHTQFVLSPTQRPGYYVSKSRTVLEVEDCPILAPALRKFITASDGDTRNVRFQITATRFAGVLGALRELHLRAGVNTGEQMIVLELQDGSHVRLSDQSHIHERIGEFTYAVSPSSFFQVNTGVATLLVNEVMAALALGGSEHVLDLYCGVGLFTLPISSQAKAVTGVESNPTATADAALNLAAHTNTHFITADVAHALEQEIVSGQAWDAIVLDPPRAGVERDTLERICALHAARMVYVSCDPATLARDARLICDRGYRLARVQPLDMFPQTHHVETVAVFVQP